MPPEHTLKEQAIWIRRHLPEMRFTLNQQYDTIGTVWTTDDPDGEKIWRIGNILETLFGAYLCGPMSNYQESYQSFGFWSQELLEHARRVFPLPDGLRPGRPIYLTPLTEEGWRMVERAYNKSPKDFLQGARWY